MKTIDLHIHTTASDGSYTPTELVIYAVEKKLSVIAMTDHDTMKGVKEAMNYIEKNQLPLQLIPGIEVSTYGSSHYMGFHILGYFLDKSDEEKENIIKNLEIDLNNSSNSPRDAIKIIASYGGLSSLAHPLEYGLPTSELNKEVRKLAALGLDGIEGIYTTHSDKKVKEFTEMATENGLIVTGGTDFHGNRKPGVDLGTGFGDLQIPYSIIDTLNRRASA